MKLIKVGAAVLNQTPLAWEQNRRNILDAIDAARADNVRLLCLPELCVTGYGLEDAFHARSVHETALQMLREITSQTADIAVCLGLPLLVQNGLFNCAALLANGAIVGFVAKRHLAGEGLHYEPRWFKAWPAGKRGVYQLDGHNYPLGDVHFDLGGVKIGFEICEDAWVANRPGGELSLQGVDLILNPSASHFAFGKVETRKRLVLEGSRAFGVTYVYTNLLGNESGRAIYDGGALIATAGRMIACGPRFSYADFALSSAVVDIDATRMAQARTGSFRPNIDGDESDRVAFAFNWPDLNPVEQTPTIAAWECGAHLKEEEFTRATTLALFDYLRKSHSHGFVVSLSGGADSTTCACLSALMVERGFLEIGREAFLAKLSYAPQLADCRDAKDVTRKLLTLVYQSTENSSKTTRDASRQVAHALNSDYMELDVDSLVKGYVQQVSQALGRTLCWETDDIALQNIQARSRAPGVWMIANIRRALLLATSNRSEAAVGYATMDGDTCGGLSPIAGINKVFIRSWLRWLQNIGPAGLRSIPELVVVTQQAPTAELRPPGAEQTDEGDLMPYEVLDAIETAAIRDKLAPIEVYRVMRGRFPQHPAARLGDWVEKFFKLWARNQWKRERYAPSFHVDDENLDPKTWCRFPILSGGYEHELRELHAYLKRENATA